MPTMPAFTRGGEGRDAVSSEFARHVLDGELVFGQGKLVSHGFGSSWVARSREDLPDCPRGYFASVVVGRTITLRSNIQSAMAWFSQIGDSGGSMFFSQAMAPVSVPQL